MSKQIDYLNKETYNFNLPEELIARSPKYERDTCKLMLLNKTTGAIEHKHFFDIVDYFAGEEILVLNDSKVIPARIFANKSTGGIVEILLLHCDDKEKKNWKVLLKGKVKDCEVLTIKLVDTTTTNDTTDNTIEVIIKSDEANSIKYATFSKSLDNKTLDSIGLIPLPPYIIQSRKKNGESLYTDKDKEYYQNIFARNEGSIASPTSGLHFTSELLERLKEKGVSVLYITLHVGFSTFVPIKDNNLRNHTMHKESFYIDSEVAKIITKAKSEKRKVVACGTTVTRVLESEYDNLSNSFKSLSGETDIFIYPPYKYKCVDRLITNFHTPYSTLLAMIMAFSSYENITNAYKVAVNNEYRFFSYGDSMFIY